MHSRGPQSHKIEKCAGTPMFYTTVDLAHPEHGETEMLAIFTYANELGFGPGLNSPELSVLLFGTDRNGTVRYRSCVNGALNGMFVENS